MARDYGSLKTDINGWLGGQVDASRIPSFIELAQDRIADDVTVLDMEKTAELDLTTLPVTVPSDFLYGRAIYLDTTTLRQRVDYLSPSAYWAKSPEVHNIDANLPRWFTVEGFTLVWTPPAADDTTATLVYYARYASFVDDGDTNWLLENKYGCYLYGALLEAQPYVGADARTGTYAALYDAAVDSVNKTARRGRFPQGQKTATARSVAVR